MKNRFKKSILLIGSALALASCGSASVTTASSASASSSTSAETVTSTAGTSASTTSTTHGGQPGGNPGGGSGGGSNNGSGDTTTEYDSTATVTKGDATPLTDTDGNAIYSGTASLTFSNTTVSINAKYIVDGVSVKITSGTYENATGSDDGAVFLVVNGGSLTIEGTDSSKVVVSKSGSGASNGQVGDEYNFYGINSGIVVAGSSSSAAISNAEIKTAANGSNAVVATLSGTVGISSSAITTTGQAGSRGLHTTYNGHITADGVSISTRGASCASLANDRGGGDITATNMTLETNGSGSPLIYSTDTISVSDSTGTANKAQMVVVEGGSSASVTNVWFSAVGGGNRSGTSETDSSTHTIDACGIIIYQSMSGDSSSGTDYFTATDSSFTLTTSSIPMIWTTNIRSVIRLTNNTFTFDNDYFLVAESTDQWGTGGSNGASVGLTASNQDLTSYKAYVGDNSSLTVSGPSFKEVV